VARITAEGNGYSAGLECLPASLPWPQVSLLESGQPLSGRFLSYDGTEIPW
jgi:hypothetical protein